MPSVITVTLGKTLLVTNNIAELTSKRPLALWVIILGGVVAIVNVPTAVVL